MRNRKTKIGIIGCGAIGWRLAEAIEKSFSQQAELFAICDINKDKAESLRARTSLPAQILSIDELIENCDLIIEAAQGSVAYGVAQKALQHNKDIMIMSVGGILDGYEQLFKLARTKGCHIYLPSGALGGLDAVKSASISKINSATLITRKPPQGLMGAPYLAEKNIDLSRIKKETVVFQGTVTEAIKGFPRNVNVCATLSIAGIGPEKTEVTIMTSPDYKDNSHEIQLEGDFGKLFTRTDNLPAPENPQSSLLAALSAIATLKDILDAVKIGT